MNADSINGQLVWGGHVGTFVQLNQTHNWISREIESDLVARFFLLVYLDDVEDQSTLNDRLQDVSYIQYQHRNACNIC